MTALECNNIRHEIARQQDFRQNCKISELRIKRFSKILQEDFGRLQE